MPTAIHRNSKFDTKLLLDAGYADIFVDHSQERTNLADNTTYFDEANSARTAIDAPRSISVVVDIKSTDSRPLLHHGTASNTYGYRINVAASVIQCAESGLLQISATMPGLAATARKCLIHWAQRIEGASVRSELLLYNFVTDQFVTATSTHNPGTTNPAATLTVGGSIGGAQLFTGGIDAFHLVRIGQRFVSTTESVNDFVAEATPPTIVGLRRGPFLTGDHGDLRLASDGHFAGPSYIMAGAATRQAAHRQVGSFANIHGKGNVERLSMTPQQWYHISFDGKPGWYRCLRYITHGELSNQVNFAHVRAHIKALDLGEGATISPISFRILSFANLQTGMLNEPKMIMYSSETETITAPNGSVGEWLDFNVKLAREPDGRSYILLLFKVDSTEDEGIEYDTAWILNTLTVDPYSKDLSEGGIGGDIEGFAY